MGVLDSFVECTGLSRCVNPRHASQYTKISIALCIATFCTLWVVVYGTTFKATRPGTDCTAAISLMRLDVCEGNYTSVSDFCGRDDGPCGNSSCEKLETDF